MKKEYLVENVIFGYDTKTKKIYVKGSGKVDMTEFDGVILAKMNTIVVRTDDPIQKFRKES